MPSTTPRLTPMDVGPDPLPNNSRGQTEGQSYNCDTDAAEFQQKYGYTIEHAFDDQLTKLLRPDPHRHDHIDDEDVRGDQITADATRQATAIAWTKGECSWETYSTIIGGNAKLAGCIEIAKIHDLGAQ